MSQSTLSVEQVRAMARKMPAGEKPKRKTQAEYLANFMATPAAPAQSEIEKQVQRGLFERHDTVAVSMRFPLAPSHNHYWESWVPKGSRRALTHVSTAGQAYQKAVKAFWMRHWKGWPPEPLTGRLRVQIVVHMARNGGDISNRIKAFEDALTEAGVWGDDDQIDDLHPIRGSVVSPTGAMDVTIEVIQ